jgi:hypothetical protein
MDGNDGFKACGSVMTEDDLFVTHFPCCVEDAHV